MDFNAVILIALFILRFSNADSGLTKKSGTIIIAGGGHPAPFPVPIPVPVPIHQGYHQGYQQQGYHAPQQYGQMGNHYEQQLPSYNAHHNYVQQAPYSHHQSHGHPNLIVLPIFAPKAHHEGYGFGDLYGHGHNFGHYNFNGFDFRA